jgi:hypothetical protein
MCCAAGRNAYARTVNIQTLQFLYWHTTSNTKRHIPLSAALWSLHLSVQSHTVTIQIVTSNLLSHSSQDQNCLYRQVHLKCNMSRTNDCHMRRCVDGRVLPEVSKNPRARRYLNVGNYLPKDSVTYQKNRMCVNLKPRPCCKGPEHLLNTRRPLDHIRGRNEPWFVPDGQLPAAQVSPAPVQLGIQRHTFRSMPLLRVRHEVTSQAMYV